MPRLSIITPAFFPELIGTPHYATDMARWFRDRGWTVRVVTEQPFYPGYARYEGYGPTRRYDNLDGNIEVLRLPTIVPKGGKRMWRIVNETYFAAHGVLRAPGHRTEAVISISPGVPWTSFIGRAVRGRGGVHLALVHDIQSGLADSLGLAGPLAASMRTSERVALNRADRVVALTTEMAEVLRRLGVSRPIDVVPVWATVPSPSAEGLAAGSKTVQYSGNFGSKHGVEVLIELAQHLSRDLPDGRLLLRGAGDRFEKLRGMAAAEGMTNVDFVAPVSEAELPGALASSPVHLVTQAPGTGHFAMPSKVVNALASGCHVLAMAEEDSSLSHLATTTLGLERFPIGAVSSVSRRAAELLAALTDGGTRAAVAAAAAGMFGRDSTLERVERLLFRRDA